MATIATTRENWQVALDKANDVRVANAATLRKLGKLRKADSLTAAAELLRHEDIGGPLGSVCVGRFVQSVRGIGSVQTDGLLAQAGVIRDRDLRKLTTRQLHVLARAMDGAAACCRNGYQTSYHPSRIGAPRA